MKNYGTRFFWIFLVTALCTWAWFDGGIKLGLDLRGGASLTYRVSTEGDEGISAERIEKARKVIEERVNATGLAEVNVTSTKQNQIVVEMPGRGKGDSDPIKQLIERNGELEFRIVAPTREQTESSELRRTAPQYYKDPPNRKWFPVKETERRGSEDLLVEMPELEAKAKVDALRKAGRPANDPEYVAAVRALDALVDQHVFRGADLAKVSVEHHGTQIVVAFELKNERKAQFGAFTEANVKRQMAIILDGQVMSAPVIESPLPGGGVINGGSKGFDLKEAQDLSIVLDSGSTGVHLQLEREETLGASMGKVAIERGIWSVLIGFLFVVLIMLWWYRIPGLVAVLALFLNVVIMLGVLAFFHAAMSLPGIAGIVLTLGMAVDANILIFERLRDERARGKDLAESLAAGYDRAMSAIIDSNVTTVLTAVVLIAMGTGPVRGFGVTLTIGLVASMFTAIYVTRAVFEWGISVGIFKNFDIGPEPFKPKLDYMGGRKWFTIPSIVLMVGGAAAFLARDENDSKDIEFVGGLQVVVQLSEPMTPEEMTVAAQGADVKYPSATPVPLAPVNDAQKPGCRWQIRVKAADEAEGEAFRKHLSQALGSKLLPEPFGPITSTPTTAGAPDRISFTVNLDTRISDATKLEQAITAKGIADAKLTPVEGSDGRSFTVTATDPGKGTAYLHDTVGQAVRSLDDGTALSAAFAATSFLEKGPAKEMWNTALQATLLSLLIQVIYIRLRFTDYNHGFAATLALVHDSCLALGAVAVADGLGLVYAKVNLTLIAAFLTLIGFSMNDTIVIFDRIRENLGKNGVLRSSVINDSVNQTFARSIRTTLTTWIVVVIQFFFNRDLGSVLEGFAWVMVTGCIAGSYSTIFIAAPLLLFLPGYGKILVANRARFIFQIVLTLVGTLIALRSEGHNIWTWVGFVLASNIGIHFLCYFIPWLAHPDPDSLVEKEQATTDDRPLAAPGI